MDIRTDAVTAIFAVQNLRADIAHLMKHCRPEVAPQLRAAYDDLGRADSKLMQAVKHSDALAAIEEADHVGH